MKIKKNNITFNISEDSIMIDWFLKAYENWEVFSFKIIDDLVDENMTFIDIGAWIGPILLYVAPKVKRVIGIDCDDVSFDSLTKNVNCNGFKDKVELEYAALYNKNTKILVGGGKRKSKWGDSGITVLNTKKYEGNKLVSAITIDDLIEKYNIEDCGFIKIDIEGGEYFIIRSMKKFLLEQKPILYISIHPHLLYSRYIKSVINNLFNIFPYIYDVNYVLLNREDTINKFIENKRKIQNHSMKSNIGHELICLFEKINIKK